MQKQAIALEGWTLDMQEQSSGVYRIRLTSQHGPQVEKTGTDEAELFHWCLNAARTIDRQLLLKSKK
jgi:hypothetical protein